TTSISEAIMPREHYALVTLAHWLGEVQREPMSALPLNSEHAQRRHRCLLSAISRPSYGPRIVANRTILAKTCAGDSIVSTRLGALHRHRGVPVALALMGMMFYVVLVPWHTLSQTILQLSQTSAVTAQCPPQGKPSAEELAGSAMCLSC